MNTAWGKPVDAFASALVRAWESGDMPRFRELASRLDAVWSDEILDAHGEDLFNDMGRAVAEGIDRTAARALSQIDLGFGPSDTDKLDFVAGRKEIASRLDSAAWRTVPYELRDRAFFSARVNDLKTLAEMKARIREALDWTPGSENGPVMDSGRFAKQMRAILINGGVRTADPTELGTLKDIMATQRLALVYKVQTSMARGFASAKTGMDPDILDAFPAYELVRVTPKRNPRPDSFWQSRWEQACGLVANKGCITLPRLGLKTSPVWQALGSLGPFGNPFEPFDWESGMGREERDRAVIEGSGLLSRNERVTPVPVPSLTARMEEGVDELGVDELDRLTSYFGDQISISDGRARWTP
jgi:hypothetical protein